MSLLQLDEFSLPEARKRYKEFQASTVLQAPETWLDLPSLDRQNLLFLRSVQHTSFFYWGWFFEGPTVGPLNVGETWWNGIHRLLIDVIIAAFGSMSNRFHADKCKACKSAEGNTSNANPAGSTGGAQETKPTQRVGMNNGYYRMRGKHGGVWC